MKLNNVENPQTGKGSNTRYGCCSLYVLNQNSRL